ncbi:MAG: hypothetical protein ACLPN5_02015 [Roseiarcus sp.]
MICKKSFMTAIAGGAALFGCLCLGALAGTPMACKPPEAGTSQAPMFSPPLGEVVVGAGRLQFYSAPNFHCPMTGVFVIAKDQLIAYASTDDGWTSVIYGISRPEGIVSGWVRSARLKTTGTMGPQQ